MTDEHPESGLLDHFQVSDPQFVVKTALAEIWRVQCKTGQHAALKVYHGSDMRNEEAGFGLLKEWQGHGAAQLLDKTSNAALVEWLIGPSLGDLTRSGEDDKANAILVEVANKLHSVSISSAVDLPDLAGWFEDLLVLEIGKGCPIPARRNIEHAKKLAWELLASQQDIAPLHGDLHHDNIRLGNRGYCAFDAKGVLGERTYELANAFRNPSGAMATVSDPARIEALADSWSIEFKVDRQRLLNWAVAKCALSIAWRCDGVIEQDDEFELLSVLIEAASTDR